MKRIVTFLILLVFFVVNSEVTLAQDEILTYSLEEGGTQTAEFQSPDGTILQIQVQEVLQPVIFRSTVSIPNRGIYKISSSLKNNWHVSYYVSINDSFKITNTSGLSINLLNGSLKNSSLTHTSTQAKLSFQRKIGLLTKLDVTTATISGKKLVVN